MARPGAYWAKVLFIELIKHFRKMTDEQIVKDIRDTMDALEDYDPNKDCFGSKMVVWAEERKEVYKSSSENGRKGGEAKAAKQAAIEKLPAECIYGKFANVYLTQDEYNALLTDIGNFNEMKDMIENLSAKLEDGNVKSDNHFATLTSWIQYRKKMDSEGKQTKQFVDHNTQVFANGLKYLEEKYGK